MSRRRPGNTPFIREPRPPKGWHVEHLPHGDKWVRDGYTLVACTGEAHSSTPGAAFIDHCSACAPLWGWVAVPKEGTC